MATPESETPAGIFQEKYGEIFPLIGKETNFTTVTGNLFAKKLITQIEIAGITTQHNLDDTKRGSAVAMHLFDKIDVDDSEKSAHCLLKICDVFESKNVNNEELKKIGADMRKKLTKLITKRLVTQGTTADAISSAKPQSSVPTTTQTNPNELNLGDVMKVLQALKVAMFIPTKWRHLGLSLGLYPTTLDVIGTANGNAVDYLEKTIQEWLAKKDQVKGTTWQILKEAVKSAGDKAAAERLHVSGISKSHGISYENIQNKLNPLTKKKIENWLEEGEVELKITRINMHGPPGAGKTCSQRLLLNEPPPEKLTDSTPIACPAVLATRISIDDKNKKWERVEIDDLINQLASTEVDEVLKSKNDMPACSDEHLTTKNKQTENKSTKTERKPADKKQTKPNKPTEVEVLQKVLKAYENGKSKKLSTNWVYFIDSGGQPAYRELLPLFTRAAALNIITIDLTKGLDEKHEFQYRISQCKSSINLKYSNREIIKSTISAEVMLDPVEIPYVSHMPDHPHYLILGTRADDESVTEAKLQEINKSLISSSNLDLKNVIPNKPGESVIFPVNTLLPAWSTERKEASQYLCTAISNCRAEMTIELPIRLFTFEIALQLKMEAKKEQRSFLTKEEVVEIGKTLQLGEESDINEALQYLHNVTIILYYHDVLPNLIFVDPVPILDILSRLIAITYVGQTEINVIAEPPPSLDKRDYLKKFGFFDINLLGSIGKKYFKHDDFQPAQMIKLLIHLHIIAKVENRKEGDYFFPCALPSCDKPKEVSKVNPLLIQPLLIAWQIDERDETTLAIPHGLFPLTIVHLLEQGGIGFSPTNSDNCYRYHDAMSLRVKKDYILDVDIINHYTHIEMHFDGHKKYCPQIRDLVINAIKKSSKDLKVNRNHIFAFKCSEKDQHYCIVKENKTSTWCTRCRPQCNVLESDDSYKCWFSDYQSSHSNNSQSSNIDSQPQFSSSDSQLSGSEPILSVSGDCSVPSTTKNPPTHLKKLGCFMIFVAVIIVLTGVTINHFIVGKNTEKSASSFFSTIISQPERSSGAELITPGAELSIEHLYLVKSVLNKARFGAANWKDLGLSLKICIITLDIIERTNGDSSDYLQKTIQKWLNKVDDVKETTWQVLIEAVRSTGDNAAAEKMAGIIKSID